MHPPHQMLMHGNALTHSICSPWLMPHHIQQQKQQQPHHPTCLPSSQMCASQRPVRTWCVTPLYAEVGLVPF